MTEGELLSLYATVPTDRVCNGCHDCATRCSGAIRIAHCEWSAILHFLESKLAPSTLARLLTEDKTFEIADGFCEHFCILYDMQSRRCAVYPVRPLVCRLLGHVEFMPCPFGRVERVLEDGHRIMVDYAQMGLRTFAGWSICDPSSAIERALGDREGGESCPW